MIENKQQLIDTLEVIRDNNLNLSAVLVLLILDTTRATYQKDIKINFSPAKLSKNITKLTETDMLQAVESKEDKWIVSILIDTGMRKSECLNLTTENIDIKNNLIRLYGGKDNDRVDKRAVS